MMSAIPCFDCFDVPIYGIIQIEKSIRSCILRRATRQRRTPPLKALFCLWRMEGTARADPHF